MMSHPADGTMVRFVDGDLTENDSAALRAHLPVCVDCSRRVEALRGVIAAIASPAVAVDGNAEAVAVLRKIRVAEIEARAPRARSWLWGGSGALAVAAAALLFVRVARRETPGEFGARGGGPQSSELARKVGVDLDVSIADRTARVTGVYRNRLDRPAHALVFAVDALDEVHWLYPGYPDAKQDPAAVVLAPKTARAAFSDGALLDAVAPGRLRIVTVVSPAPLHVSDIEHLTPQLRTPEGLRARFPGCDVREQSVVLK